MKANDLILLADGACNPETPLIRIMPLFKLVWLELSILWLLRTTIEDWIKFELWPFYLNINSFFGAIDKLFGSNFVCFSLDQNCVSLIKFYSMVNRMEWNRMVFIIKHAQIDLIWMDVSFAYRVKCYHIFPVVVFSFVSGLLSLSLSS